MDTALELRIKYDNGQKLTDNEIDESLATSNLVKLLTADFIEKPLFAVWRIIALSEIPYSGKLDYTKQLVQWIIRNLATEEGFSLTGKPDYLLPCYNAMIIYALSKIGYAEDISVLNAVHWIIKYQPFSRQTVSSWSGSGAKKYGGCFKNTPCFIGVSKSVKALLEYKKAIQASNTEIDNRLAEGIEYILQHRLFKRLRDDEPITGHILEIAFPESYHLNIIELLSIMADADKLNDERTGDAFLYLEKKKNNDRCWKINSGYKSSGYMTFDKRGDNGDWVSYLLNKFQQHR